MISNFVIGINFCIILWVKLSNIMHFSYFRTLSFDDSNPRAARKGRKPLNPTHKDSLQKSLLDPADDRRRSWHSEEISTYFLDFGISSKGKITHVAPIVIISIQVLRLNLPTSPPPPLTWHTSTIYTRLRRKEVQALSEKYLGNKLPCPMLLQKDSVLKLT